MVTLRLFASIREIAGINQIDFEANTVGQIIELAVERFGPEFAATLPACRIWVNGNPAQEADEVSDGDEVAILPPVSGGAYE
ncbi:MAG: MoaD/ThiS family protein [Actinomycetota bacterium]|nr:MoaD/ThiS family protein [Actinomycetota bacterium]MEC8974892.1 MoaD/ThiS family protein [Actinomycetota bacterium]